MFYEFLLNSLIRIQNTPISGYVIVIICITQKKSLQIVTLSIVNLHLGKLIYIYIVVYNRPFLLLASHHIFKICIAL